MRYAEALDWLYGRQRFGIKLGLENVRALLERLGRPQDAFRALHVTGTNGKGSACAFLESALRAAGHRVGLFTSPHLTSFRERIRVQGEPAGEAEIAAATEKVRAAVEPMDVGSLRPTFFECVTAVAYEIFRAEKVPLVVLEVGMGGRLDATNECRPLATVVTNVALEHTQHLGTSVQAIAQEKAGIFKPGVPAVTGARGPALDVIAREATRVKCPLRVVRRPDPVEESLEATRFRFPYAGTPTEFEAGLLGEFQAHNAALALAAVEAAAPEAPVPLAAAQRGIREARWPGRLEVTDRDPLTLLDGAHNPAAMDELCAFLDRHFPHRDVAAVVGILREKNASKMLGALVPRVARLVLTRVPNDRSLAAEELRDALPPDPPPHEVVPDASDALRRGLAHGGERVRLVTGSLFLVGEARAQLFGLERDPPTRVPLVQ